MADSDPVVYTPRVGLPKVPDGKRDWGQHWRQQQDEIEYKLAGTTVGNPNGKQHGYYVGQMCWDSQAGAMYACKKVGIPASAEWIPISDQGTVPISRGGTGQTTAANARAALEVHAFYGANTYGYRPGINDPQPDTKMVIVRSDGYGQAADSWDHMPVQVQNHNGGHAGYAWHNPGVNAGALVMRRDNGAPEWWCTGFVAGAAVYRGMIFPFWGSINQIPPGYSICDGTNGTPNLVGKVVVGTAGGYLAPGTNFGAETAATSAAGQHNHGQTGGAGAHAHDGITQGTALNIGHMPAHTHTVMGAADSGNNTGAFLTTEGPTNKLAARSQTTSSAGSGAPHAHGFVTNPVGDHTHTIPGDGNHAHNVDVRQPSTALYYIMKL